MTCKELLGIAASQIGVKENPPMSNNVKYNTWYYGHEVSGRGYPWCMVFVQWVFAKAGVDLPVRTASCGALMRAAQSAGKWVTRYYQPGDVVIYDFPGGAMTDHCGIVESVSGATITAIEGNTSTGNDSDGGEVMRRTRNLYQICGAWRPKEEEMTQDQFDKMMNVYLENLSKEKPGDWGLEWKEAKDWAESNGIIRGDTEGEKQYKSFTTRQAIVLMLYRLVNDVL